MGSCTASRREAQGEWRLRGPEFLRQIQHSEFNIQNSQAPGLCQYPIA
jgi:hypothetical protein